MEIILFRLHCSTIKDRHSDLNCFLCTLYHLRGWLDRSVCGIINTPTTVNFIHRHFHFQRDNSMEQCLSKVHDWLLHNWLLPNPAKSDAVQFTTGRGRHCEDNDESVSVSEVAITPSASVKSLGVTLDSRLSLDQHVTDVCKSCYFHIRALLPDDVAKTV